MKRVVILLFSLVMLAAAAPFRALYADAYLCGTVLDKEDLSYLSATVSIPELGLQTETDEQGFFAFWKNYDPDLVGIPGEGIIPPGSYRVVVTAEGFLDRAVDVVVQEPGVVHGFCMTSVESWKQQAASMEVSPGWMQLSLPGTDRLCVMKIPEGFPPCTAYVCGDLPVASFNNTFLYGKGGRKNYYRVAFYEGDHELEMFPEILLGFGTRFIRNGPMLPYVSATARYLEGGTWKAFEHVYPGMYGLDVLIQTDHFCKIETTFINPIKRESVDGADGRWWWVEMYVEGALAQGKILYTIDVKNGHPTMGIQDDVESEVSGNFVDTKTLEKDVEAAAGGELDVSWGPADAKVWANTSGSIRSIEAYGTEVWIRSSAKKHFNINTETDYGADGKIVIFEVGYKEHIHVKLFRDHKLVKDFDTADVFVINGIGSEFIEE